MNIQTLNDFEKKTIIASLKEFDILNLCLNVEHGQSKYVIFFKKAELIFSEKIDYCLNHSNDKPNISGFIQKCKKVLSDTSPLIDNYLYYDVETCNIEHLNIIASFLTRKVMNEQVNHLSFDFAFLGQNYFDSYTEIYIQIFEKITNAVSPRDAIADCFDFVGLLDKNIEVKISNFKHQFE